MHYSSHYCIVDAVSILPQVGMSPGFKIFQTKPQGNAREITLQNGETFTSPYASMSNRPEVLLTRRNTQLHVAFYDTGITLIIKVYERPSEYNTDFEVRVPQTFRQKTRGFLGNFDSDPSNEFYRRSGTDLVLQSDRLSDAQIIDVYQSCKFYRAVLDHLRTSTLVTGKVLPHTQLLTTNFLEETRIQ